MKKVNCIFETIDEFEQVIKCLLGDDVVVDVDFGELYFESKQNEDEGIDTETIYKALSSYYNVDVTSIHTDGCEYLGVWIAYNERLRD